MGRRSKLTPDVQDKIVKAVRDGNWDEVAARAGGLDHSTFYRWLGKGEKATSGIYRDFYDAVKQAEAEHEAEMVGIITAGARGEIVEKQVTTYEYFNRKGAKVTRTTVTEKSGKDASTAIKYLERRHSARWKPRLAVEVDPREALAKLLGVEPDQLPPVANDGAAHG